MAPQGLIGIWVPQRGWKRQEALGRKEVKHLTQCHGERAGTANSSISILDGRPKKQRYF